MKSKMKWLFGLLLGLALMLGMSLTAYADDTSPYANLKNTTTEITFDGKFWYLIDYDANTVTLLSKECVADSQYNSSGSFVEYSSNPTVKTAVDTYYTNSISPDAKKAVSGGEMFLLTIAQANALSIDVRQCSEASGAYVNGWWLRSQGADGGSAVFVHGESGDVYGQGYNVDYTFGVRPALKLNLSKVIFSSESNTFSTIPVTSVALEPSTAQKTTVGEKVSFTATIEPTSATDKTVKWSVSNSNVALYSDADCTTPVGTDATDTLTVYAKGIEEGSATVTVTSTADSGKSSSCDVTVYPIHTHDGITFALWTATDSLPTSGSYYLTSDVTMNSEWSVTQGTINLCLNGKTVICPGSTVSSGATLNLYGDDAASGKFTANQGITNNGTFEINGAAVNVASYGLTNKATGILTITGTSTVEGTVTNGGTFNLSGNPSITKVSLVDDQNDGIKRITITGALDSNSPIPVDIHPAMKEGVLTNSTTTTYNDASKFTSDSSDYKVGKNADGQLLLGLPYSVTYDANGGTGTMTDSGSPYANGSSVTVKANGFTAPTGFTFAGWNTRADGSGTMYVPGDSTSGTFAIAADTTLYAIWTHTHGQGSEAVTFYAWTDAAAKAQKPGDGVTAANTLPTIEGSYCLTKDVTLEEKAWTPAKFSTKKTNLCLNGYSIIQKSDGSNCIYVYSGSELNLYDDNNSGSITHESGKTGEGVFVQGNFTMYGGIITGNNVSGSGAGVEVCDNNAKFNMYGGSVIGNNCTLENGDGASVIIRNGEFHIKGNPVISGNTIGTSDSQKKGNVDLLTNKAIFIDGPLDSTVSIGVTKTTPGVFTSGLSGKLPSGKTVADIFTSDNDAYFITQDSVTNEGLLRAKLTVTYNASGADEGTSTVPVDTNKYLPDAEVTIMEPDLTMLKKNGYAFNGWIIYTSDGQGGQTTTHYEAGNTFTINTDTTIYANWKLIASFDGDPTRAQNLVYNGQAQNLVAADPTVVTGGTMLYSTESTPYDYTEDAVNNWHTRDDFKQTNANVEGYPVYFFAKGDDEHADSPIYGGPGKAGSPGFVVSIAKKAPEADDFTYGAPTASLIYDGNAKNSTLTANNDTMGTVTVKYYLVGEDQSLTAVERAVNAGTYVVKASMSEGSNFTAATNENEVTADGWKFTITEADSTPATVTANNRTADGTEKALVIVDESTLVGGTMYYAIGDNSTTAPVFDGTSQSADKKWKTDIPSAKNTGDYYVWYMVKGDENHNDTEPECVTVAIKRRSSPSYPSSYTITFKVTNGAWDDGTRANKTVNSGSTLTSGQIPSVGSKPDEGYMAGSWDSVPGTTVTRDATYTYIYVEKPSPTITKEPAARDLTEDKQPQELITAGEVTGGTMQYALGSDAFTAPTDGYSTSLPTATNPGIYYVWYKEVGDEEHRNIEPICIVATIKEDVRPEAIITKAPSARDLTQTGEAQELVTAGEATGGTMEYGLGTPAGATSFSTSIPTAIKAGTYYLWYRAVGDEEHSNTKPEPIVVTIKFDSSTLLYNGEEQNLIKPGSAEGGTMVYKLDNDDVTPPTDGWSETIPTGKMPGDYYVWYKVLGDENHNDSEPMCIKVTIVPDNRVEQFLNLLETLPDEVGREDAELVDSLRSLYDALPDVQKGLIPKEAVKELEDSEKEIKELKAEDQGKADAVSALIDQLPDPETIKPENKTAVDAVQRQFDALTDAQKSLVPKENREKLEALKNALAGPSPEDQAIATQFTTAVNEVPGNMTRNNRTLVDNATAIFSTMTEAQKALVSSETMDLYNEELDAFTPGRDFRSGDAYYRVLSNGNVTYHHPAKRTLTSVVVPEVVQDGKFFFTINKISNNAFRGCLNLQWAIFGKNVYVLGEKIFANDKHLTKVKVLSSRLESGKVTDAFLKAGNDGGLTVKVPGSKVDDYKELFKKEGGLKGKVVSTAK